MTRRFSFITIVGAALVLTAPAFGKGQPAESVWEDALVAKSNGTYLHYRGGEQGTVAPTSVWEQALIARSQGLNARYGLGQHSPALKALQYRSEALNRQYGLGEFAKIVPSARLTESIVSREQTARAMRQARQTLGKVIVEFTRQAAPFIFVRRNEPSGKTCGLALRPPPARPLQE